MEHSLSSLELSHPWRRATLVASAVAALELVLLVVLTVLLVGRPVAERIEQAAAAPPAPTPATAPKPAAKAKRQTVVLPRGETSVLILNGNGRSGAAGLAGAQVKGHGYLVAAVGNAPRTDYRRTLVLYRPGMKGEAQRLARDLGTGIVAPLDGLTKSEMMGAHVALILGP
jgi:hypothetical protein